VVRDKLYGVRARERARRHETRALQTRDIWLCQCTTCGTANPVQPAFRGENSSGLVFLAVAATKIPETCSGCGQPLSVWDSALNEDTPTLGENNNRRAERGRRKKY
jgi:predicted RNA-binding Zn-ribbon protein involved in translation (DUF1610 family)